MTYALEERCSIQLSYWKICCTVVLPLASIITVPGWLFLWKEVSRHNLLPKTNWDLVLRIGYDPISALSESADLSD